MEIWTTKSSNVNIYYYHNIAEILMVSDFIIYGVWNENLVIKIQKVTLKNITLGRVQTSAIRLK